MTPCATPQKLEHLVNNLLEGQERETLVAHVQECASCQQVLEQLTRDTLLPAGHDQGKNRTETELLQFLKIQGPDLIDAANRAILHAGTAAVPVLASGATPVIAGFKIVREIGRGGMGVVYEAEQEVLSRRVALKVLPSHALVHPTQLQRFERETKAAARLHHTNIVPVFAVGEQEGLHYYVMQFIEGSGLDIVLAELRRRQRPDNTPHSRRREYQSAFPERRQAGKPDQRA